MFLYFVHVYIRMYVCMHVYTILLRYNLSESLQEHCDLPQIRIVISPLIMKKKYRNIIQTLPNLRNSYVPKIRLKSKSTLQNIQ